MHRQALQSPRDAGGGVMDWSSFLIGFGVGAVVAVIVAILVFALAVSDFAKH